MRPMSADPVGIEERIGPAVEAVEESRLERLAIRAVRIALLIYLLPALCVGLAVTWLALIPGQVVLVAVSALRRCVAGPGPAWGRSGPESWSGGPTRSPMVASAFRASSGERSI